MSAPIELKPPIFTRDYWLLEIQQFRVKVVALELTDDQARQLVRGLCYLASETVKQNPENKQGILREFLDCYRLIKARMGDDWMFTNKAMIERHGGPPEDLPE